MIENVGIKWQIIRNVDAGSQIIYEYNNTDEASKDWQKITKHRPLGDDWAIFREVTVDSEGHAITRDLDYWGNGI